MQTFILRMLGAYLDTLSLIAPSRAAEKGFMLFCRPMRLQTTEKQHAFFRSAEKFQLSVEENLIQGYRWGTGKKKILFLHGWQSHTYRWKPYIEALPKNEYTIYSLDAPGHGLSTGNFLSVPLYSSLIEDFIRKEQDIHTVVGHSLGGFSILYTLYRVPQLAVERLILLSTPGEANDFILSFKKTLGISDRTVKLLLGHFEKRYQVTPGFFSASKFAERVNASGLIIHDEDDPEAPYHYAIPLRQAWKRARLVTTKGYGHNLKSPSVVKEVADFIREPVLHETV